ncbi:hypothetical protein CLOACE_13550 [Clostridium acetireducens DSM 10703]|uniref:Uncharacterized protein n=1 Tax=Clostridium acetireducens DSM 10703 TaxID=1121290 RepID=A0A1E8EYE0_9CLOT|nr:conjugal transfer protein TrbL family protein [Clostridium acetireducens]OFI05974.1 hypothetical protein CLOACE_13550 [Clostridium acetireducens DSM 10703]
MEELLVMLIAGILSGCLVYVNSLLNDLVPIDFHAEKYMDTLLGTNGFTEVFNIFLCFGISLIVLKFLKKGFEQYILWTEGDADADTLIFLTVF